MQLMARYPDRYFDLAIVDPPYGINAGNKMKYREGRAYQDIITNYKKGDWDLNVPDKSYFTELFRVSKNQIIWGANHFTNLLPPSRGWCYWDKGYTSEKMSYSDAELAYTSFDKTLKKCQLKMSDWRNCISNNRDLALANPNIKIHPTQKPIKLYKWLLDRYAIEGDKILDTHLGSGSIAIACHDYGFDLTACELDKDYFDSAIKRLKKHQAQLGLFNKAS